MKFWQSSLKTMFSIEKLINCKINFIFLFDKLRKKSDFSRKNATDYFFGMPILFVFQKFRKKFQIFHVYMTL